MAVDLLIVLALLCGLVAGLRRGFFKEATAIAALFFATLVTVGAYGPMGPMIARGLGLPVDVGYLLVAVAVWFFTFFVVIVLGRLAYRSLRGEGPIKRTEERAEAVAGRPR